MAARHYPTPHERLRAAAPAGAPDECWLWTGMQNGNGYGITRVDGRRISAHRLAYVIEVGPVPDGMTLDHTCRVRLCTNPRHLEPVTHAENVRRGNSPSAVAARTGLCARGHELPPKQPGERQRWCRVCAASRDAARRR